MAEQETPQARGLSVCWVPCDRSDHHCATCPGFSPSLQLADSQLQRALSFFLRLTHLAARILEPSIERESGGLIVHGKSLGFHLMPLFSVSASSARNLDFLFQIFHRIILKSSAR